MLEKLKGISIQGRCFQTQQQFIFFPTPKTDKFALVYGRNGCGKSTCSQGIKNYKQTGASSEGLTLELLDEDANPIEKNAVGVDWEQCIHVFDEEYVEKKLKIKDDGLGSVVLFGEQVEIDNQVAKLEEDRSIVEIDLKKCQEVRTRLSDISYEKSPHFIRKEIDKSLKAENGWAHIDGKIKGIKVNSKVDDTLFEEFRSLVVSETEEELCRCYNENFNLFSQIQEPKTEYLNPIESEVIADDIDAKILEVLECVVERPELSVREQRIFEVLTSSVNRKNEIVNEFSRSDVDVCPFCFQTITPEYKTQLLRHIAEIFNQDAEKLQINIEKLRQVQINRNFTQYKGLNEELTSTILECVDKCNEIKEQYNVFLKQKYDNVFTVLEVQSLNLALHVHELNEKLGELEVVRQKYVTSINRRDSLKKELRLLNRKLWKKRLEYLFSLYENALQKKHDIEIRCSELSNRDNHLRDEIVLLKQRKKNITIAIERINHDLSFVFFDKDHIRLELGDGDYRLKVDGTYVRPRDVSCGERNAIALCYFFTEVFSEKDVNRLHAGESLFVLDDPVSSFDIGNRVGINSYLKYKLQAIVEGNSNSKVIIFSHDVVTVWDLESALGEICKARKEYTHKKCTYNVYELRQNSLESFQIKKRHEYSILLKDIYKFALNQEGDSLTIGNVIRRVLEAFSTFIYKTGMAEISCQSDLSHLFGEKKQFFNNLMYRLVLHGDSHTEQAMRACSDEVLCFHYSSVDEKQRIARYVIAMLYTLQKEHVLLHLKLGEENVKEIIETWLNDIPNA